MRLVVLTTLALTALASAARADDFDAASWTLLGELELRHGEDRSLHLAAYTGDVAELAVVARSGAPEIDKVRILDADALIEVLRPNEVVSAEAGPLILELNPPVHATRISITSTFVDKKDGTARVRVFGRDRAGPVALVAAEAAEPTADTRKPSDLGWTLLGEDEVDLVDDEIVVGKKKRKATYSQIKVVVVGDAVKLRTLDVHLGGKKAKVQTEAPEQTYGDGDDSVVIDIRGKRRTIKKVRLTYQKHRLDASTRVQVYAR